MSDSNPHKKENNQRSLAVISRGAGLFFFGKILSTGLGFVLNILLTRTLGAALFGIYAYANTIVGFFMVFARLGTGKAVLRFLPATGGKHALRNWYAALALLTALIASIGIGIALFVLAPWINAITLGEDGFETVLRILAVVLPINTLSNLINAIFRALEKLEYQVLVKNVIQPTVQILLVAIAFLLGYSLIGAVAALAIASILVLTIAFSIMLGRTAVNPFGHRITGDRGEFFNFSLPLTLKDVGHKLYTRVDILMVGFFLTGSAVGIYQIAIIVTSFLTLPLSGINQLFPPVAARLHSDGSRDELREVYEIVTRWTFTIVIPPALVLMIYGNEVLSMFGEEFTAGVMVMFLFAIAQLTNCAVGPSGFLLMMTNHQYLNLFNQWALGIGNVVMNYVLILEFGFIGAALATAGTLTAINLLRVVEVWYFEDMTPYSSKFVKPIGAGVVLIPLLIGLTLFIDGLILLFVGTIVAGIVFVALLYLFGIEKEDKEFYRETIAPQLSQIH